MPEGTLTLEQVQWANEYLRLLGEESEPARDGEADGSEHVDRYGEGYQQVDTRPLPKALQDALDAGTLPSANDWDTSPMGPSPQELADFDTEKVAITGNLAKYKDLKTLGDERNEL